MGISLICGGQYGNWNSGSANTDGTGESLSKKVWRDPAYLQLLHNQESERLDFGNAHNARPVTSVGAGESDDIKEAGHYFPTTTKFDGAKSTANLTIAESQSADVNGHGWAWEDVAHDTFSHTFFPTHWYSSQQGNTLMPYKADTIANDHRVDSGPSGKYGSTTNSEVYTVALSSPISFEFSDDDYTYTGAIDAFGNPTNKAGDALLPATCNTYEVDYNTGTIANPDHLIDSNDQISARYSIDFDHQATAFNSNTGYGQTNTIENTLGDKLGDTFGQSGADFFEVENTPSCAITHVKLVNQNDEMMSTTNYNGTDNQTNSIPIAEALTTTSLDPIKFSTNVGQTVIDKGDSLFADDGSNRPRIWQTTFKLTFTGVKTHSGGADFPNDNPDKVQFFSGTDKLFTIQLADKDAENLHNVQLPGVNPTSTVTDEFDNLSLGQDFTGTEWEDENNLVVELTFYTG